MKIDGVKTADDIILRLGKIGTPDKILAVVLIGDDPRSISFIKQKEKAANKLGIDFRVYKFSDSLGNDGLRKEIGRIARQGKVGGIIVQIPIHDSLNEQYILNAIPREKDIDVLGERALGAFYNNRNTVLPPSVETVREILKATKTDIENLSVAVVGMGRLVGRPISVWMMGRCKNLYLLNKDSDKKILSKADIVISGVGKAGILEEEMFKDGAGVIDFGYYYFSDGKVSGDINVGDSSRLAFYTPTPGGTGPILVAKLLENFYSLCQRK